MRNYLGGALKDTNTSISELTCTKFSNIQVAENLIVDLNSVARFKEWCECVELTNDNISYSRTGLYKKTKY